MKATLLIKPSSEKPDTQYLPQATASVLFAQETVVLTKQEHIKLIGQINYWQALHTQARHKLSHLEQDNLQLKAKIKDL